MTFAWIVILGLGLLFFAVMILALLEAPEKESLDEQARIIREDMERRKKAEAEKAARKAVQKAKRDGTAGTQAGTAGTGPRFHDVKRSGQSPCSGEKPAQTERRESWW